jgi:hypothetical protein
MRPYPGDEAFDAEVQARSEKLKAAIQRFGVSNPSTQTGVLLTRSTSSLEDLLVQKVMHTEQKSGLDKASAEVDSAAAVLRVG